MDRPNISTLAVSRNEGQQQVITAQTSPIQHRAPPAYYDQPQSGNMAALAMRSYGQHQYRTADDDALTLPPIRQAVPELDMRPPGEAASRYPNPERVVPSIESGDGSSPPYYARERQVSGPYYTQPRSMYSDGRPVDYRGGPYPGDRYGYPQSEYPPPQYDQPPPGYGAPTFAGAYDSRPRHMAQPSYPPAYHPQEYRGHHEQFANSVGPMHAPDGKGTQRKRRGNLPKETTDKLRSWFHAHLHHPYPTEDEKQELMMITGLQMNQISNWFINARRRQLPALLNDQKANDGRKTRTSDGPNGNYSGGNYDDSGDEDASMDDDEAERPRGNTKL